MTGTRPFVHHRNSKQHEGPAVWHAQQANLLVAPFSFQKLAAQDFVFEMLPPALYSGTS